MTVKVDGATLQNNASTFFGPYSVWDLEQVEIFRGPQSTQQGRNALAGAIVLRSADPTYELDGKARVSVGSLGTAQASGAVNLPLVDDRLSLRLSVDGRESDGWVENPTRNEEDYDFRESINARGKLRFDPSDRFSGQLTFSYTDSSGGEDIVQRADFPQDRFNFSDEAAEEGSVHEITTLDLTYLLSDRWTVQSTTNLYDHEYIRVEDTDLSALPGNRLQIDQGDDGFSQQLRFLYGGGGGSQAVFGIYYADLDDQSLSQATLPASVLGLPPGFQVTGFLENRVETENVAIFGEIDVALNDRLTLTAGARYDDESRTDANAQETTVDPPLFPIPSQPPLSLDSDYDAFLPKLGLTYEISEAASTSFTVQRGYRAGGRSQSLISLTVSDFDPEFTTNYEWALRTYSPSNGLRFNANVFYIDWEDQQVSVRTALGSSFDVITVNAGSSQLYGLEAQLDYRAHDALDLFVSLGLTDTEFEDFVDGGFAFDGNQFPFAPETSLAFGASWRPAERWRLDGTVSYQDSYFSDQANSAAFEVDDRTLVNLKLSYELEPFIISAFARNLLDEDYILEALPEGVRTGEPQVFGFELSFGL